MTRFYLEFSDIAPTAVEQRETDTTSINGLAIPAEAVRFAFLDGDGRQFGPTYWGTDSVDRGELDELTARHPEASAMFADYAEEKGVTEFAHVTWTDPQGQYDVNALLPLVEGFEFVERTTGRRLFV